MPAVIDVELAIHGERTRLAAPSTRPAGAFRETKRTAWTELAWDGDTCPVGSLVATWGDRYAATLGDGIAVVDARGEKHARLAFDFDLAGALELAARDDGWLAIGLPECVLAVPLTALENLVDVAGPVEVVMRVSYPRRREEAREPAIVAWLYDNHDALVNVKGRQIWLDGKLYGLGRAMRFTLCDELWPREFAAIEVPGQPRRALRELETERRFAGRVTPGLPLHPLRHAIQPAEFQLDRALPLLVRLADDPDDDGTRGVIIDVLQEAGVPYARQLAEARASVRVTSQVLAPILGPLTHVFTDVQWRAGLPWRAQLVPQLPADDALLALVGGDARLGMLRELRRGSASIANLVRVLQMPLAIGVRCVDSCSEEVLQALVDAGLDRLVCLRGVPITKKPVQALLAGPTFDRVRELEVKAAKKSVDGILGSITADRAGCFARVPRRVSLVDDGGGVVIDQVLARWATLPVSAISACGITLEREGRGPNAPTRARVSGASAKTIDALKRRLPAVPIEPSG